jgi:hypothetical protein
MKRFRVQMTVVWYEDYDWEKSEHDYYDSEEEYIEATKFSILEDGFGRVEWHDIDFTDIIVEVEDTQ